MRDFRQLEWDDQLEEDCRTLTKLAVQEDLGLLQDWTTVALVPAERTGTAHIVARERGIVAGIQSLATVLEEMQAGVDVEIKASDGDSIAANTTVATLRGKVRDILTCERTLLNLLARLMGIATLSNQYVQTVQGTGARIYDTRKTTPGYRRLEKYAVRCGGGCNHRTGLYDAILIKDNHLAQRAERDGADPAAAVTLAREFLQRSISEGCNSDLLVEIEVDNLMQLETVLPSQPDIVLLDNMTPAELRKAVQMRTHLAPEVQLEASGGVHLKNLREIAETGVDRISVGALTHSARSLDIGLDWNSR